MALVAGYGDTFSQAVTEARNTPSTAGVPKQTEAAAACRCSLQVLVVVAGHFLLAWMLLVAALFVAIAASVVTAAIAAVATTATTAAAVAAPGV